MKPETKTIFTLRGQPRELKGWHWEVVRRTPRRVLAAWNCLRGRPTMYQIKLRGAFQLHHMNGLLVTESEFTDGDGLSVEHVNQALIMNNTVTGAARSGIAVQD